MKNIQRFLFLSILLLTFSQISDAAQAFLAEPAVAAYSPQTAKKRPPKGEKYEGVNSWTPYFTNIDNVQNDYERTFVLSTVGVGFIYFSKVQGNTSLTPAPAGSVTNGTKTKQVGGFSYNRTPVYDMVFGYRILSWLKAGLALQAQNNIHFQSPFAPTLVPAGSTRTSDASLPKTQFRANIDLNALYLKAMFDLPWVMVLKSWMYALYFNVGVGVSWQSWTDIRQYIQYTINDLQTTFVNTLHQKYGASALWQLDAGFRAKSASPSATVSFLIGCKFNGWGKIPNIGDSTQQGSWSYAFKQPYSARMLYSFAPYIGIQWDF